MAKKEENTFTLEDVLVKRVTEKAFLISLTDDEGKPVEMWLPKSQIRETDCLADGDKGYIIMTGWIAQQKGFIEDDD